MVKLVLLILALVLIDSKVYQMVSLFRHGARYYLNPYYDWNDTFWGQLSAVGMRQHQKLGQMLRRDYIDRHVISDIYNQNEVQIYSTDRNRTFTSALSQLFGLFPLGKGPKLPQIDKKYHLPPYQYKTDASDQQFALPKGHQPIPVTKNQSVLPSQCPRESIQFQNNEKVQLQTFKEMNLTYFPFIKRMSQIFNFQTLNFSALHGLYDSVEVDRFLGKPLPTQFTDADYNNLKHLAVWHDLFKFNFNIARAYNTYPIKRILQDFDGRISNLKTKPLKWTILSAHDYHINCFLNYLNISSASCIEQLYRKKNTSALNCEPGPEYAANLIFQLQSDNDKDFYVKIRYNGKYVNLCQKKSTICDYKDWKGRMQKIMLDNPNDICYGKAQKFMEDIENDVESI